MKPAASFYKADGSCGMAALLQSAKSAHAATLTIPATI